MVLPRVEDIMISGEKLDVTDTFTASVGGYTNETIRPASGEVWKISMFAVCTANGSTGDTNSLRLYDGTYYKLIDSETGSINARATTGVDAIQISYDQYLVIRYQADATGSNRTITYYYQGSKVS
jgi:hypothetical protein